MVCLLLLARLVHAEFRVVILVYWEFVQLEAEVEQVQDFSVLVLEEQVALGAEVVDLPETVLQVQVTFHQLLLHKDVQEMLEGRLLITAEEVEVELVKPVVQLSEETDVVVQ